MHVITNVGHDHGETRAEIQRQFQRDIVSPTRRRTVRVIHGGIGPRGLLTTRDLVARTRHRFSENPPIGSEFGEDAR